MVASSVQESTRKSISGWCARAISIILSEKSIPITRAPRSWSFLDKYPVPQPASSTVRPWTSPANAQSTGSEFRIRLPSPSSPTCIRQSSATRFQKSRVASYSSLLIALPPAAHQAAGAVGNGHLLTLVGFDHDALPETTLKLAAQLSSHPTYGCL